MAGLATFTGRTCIESNPEVAGDLAGADRSNDVVDFRPLAFGPDDVTVDLAVAPGLAGPAPRVDAAAGLDAASGMAAQPARMGVLGTDRRTDRRTAGGPVGTPTPTTGSTDPLRSTTHLGGWWRATVAVPFR